MSEKLGARLRQHGFKAQHFFIGLNSQDYGWLGQNCKLMQATDDGKDIYQLGLIVLNHCWQGENVYQIQVTAHDPQTCGNQVDLFCQFNEKRQKINKICDQINSRYGEFTIAPVPLLERSSMPNVIAPAWKPTGHRQTI